MKRRWIERRMGKRNRAKGNVKDLQKIVGHLERFQLRFVPSTGWQEGDHYEKNICNCIGYDYVCEWTWNTCARTVF